MTTEGAEEVRSEHPQEPIRLRRLTRAGPASRLAGAGAVLRHRSPRDRADFSEGAALESTYLREGIYRRALAVADVAAVVVTVLVVLPLLTGDTLLLLALASAPISVLLNKALRLYERDELVLNKTTLDEVPTLAQAAGVGTLLMWLALDAWTTVELDATHVVVVWATSFALALTARMLTRAALREVVPAERCLVVGDRDSATVIEHKIAMSRVNARVVATMRLEGINGPPDCEELGRVFRELLTQHRPDRAIIAPAASDGADTLELIRSAKHGGVRVTVVPHVLEVVGSSVEFDQLDGLLMLGVRCFGLTRSSRVLKRVFDLVGTTVLLLATLPWMLLIAAAIRLDSPGPAFFRQTRVGRDGRRFEMLKFRSMTTDADALKDGLRHLNESTGLFKLKDDPRMTRVGRFLRRTSLDELPQLVNVWRGEMSLVGPRPLVVDEDVLVTGYYRHRLHLTPGMTGPWQILGAARVPMGEMVAIDYMYVANWSLWTDVKILMRTIPHVFGSRGM